MALGRLPAASGLPLLRFVGLPSLRWVLWVLPVVGVQPKPGSEPSYEIPEEAKPLLAQPTRILEITNIVCPPKSLLATSLPLLATIVSSVKCKGERVYSLPVTLLCFLAVTQLGVLPVPWPGTSLTPCSWGLELVLPPAPGAVALGCVPFPSVVWLFSIVLQRFLFVFWPLPLVLWPFPFVVFPFSLHGVLPQG